MERKLGFAVASFAVAASWFAGASSIAQLISFEVGDLSSAVNSSVGSSQNAVGISSATLQIGTGIAAQTGAGALNATGFNQTSGSSAMSNGDYWSFVASPAANYSLSFTSIRSYHSRGSSNTAGATAGWYSSLNNYATAIASVNPVSTSRTSPTSLVGSLSSTGATTATTFRIAGWGNFIGTLRVEDSGAANTADVVLSGASTLRSAGTLVWDGGRGDANWNTYSGTAANQSNWNLNNIPATTLVDNLEFAGSTQLTSTNNIIGLTVGSIAFNSGASAFTVGGNAITLNSGVTNNSANLQTVNLPITLGAAQTINAASGDLALGGTIANGGFLLSVDGANNSTISQAVSGNGGLSKTGSGTLTLGGTNTYTGTTTIANGTLTLASTGSIASNTSVAGGATLSFDNGAELTGDVGVSGTLTGAVNVDGNVTINASGTLTGDALITGDLAMNGSLSPGASPGYVLASNVYFGDSASTLMEIESLSSFDLVEAENSMSYDGALTIDISGTYAEGSSFDLFDFAGTALGDFNSISLTGDYGSIPMTGAGTWTATLGGTLFTFTGSTGVLSLSAQAIPEPLTAAGVMLLASRVLGRRARVSL